jgi:hypothetical protein
VIGRKLPGSECLGEQLILAVSAKRFEISFAKQYGPTEYETVVKSQIFGDKVLHFLKGDYVVVEDRASEKWSLYKTLERSKYEDHIRAFAIFSRGRWSPLAPSQPGTYATRTRAQHRGPDHTFVLKCDRLMDISGGFLGPGKVTNWVGDFWSEPWPQLPGCL